MAAYEASALRESAPAAGRDEEPPSRRRRNYGIGVSFPAANTVRFSSPTLFTDCRSEFARQFYLRAFRAVGVARVAIDADARTADIVLDRPVPPGDPALIELARALARDPEP